MTFSKSLGAAITLLLASPALAGSTDTPVFPVTQIAPAAIPVAPAATNDWSGFYAGGIVSFDSAGFVGLFDTNDGTLGASSPMNDSTSYGGFAGYNFQRGAFVYGGEFAATSGGLATTLNPNNIYYEEVFDLKARAGYSFGSALIYGVVGGSYSNLHWGEGFNAPSTGLTYGGGVEYMVGQQLFVGAEYLVRDLTGERDDNFPEEARVTTQSAQLRVGWKF